MEFNCSVPKEEDIGPRDRQRALARMPASTHGDGRRDEAEAANPVPILVVGRHRSGTKWLSNILLNHTAIAGVQSDEHCGIVEAGIFGGIDRLLGDFTSRENYLAFVVLWSRSDFFRASRLPPDFFLKLPRRPESPYEAFVILMNAVARGEMAGFWLQKLSPKLALRFLSHFPHCRVVLIERDLRSQLESNLQLAGSRSRYGSLARLTVGYVADSKILRKIRRQTGAETIRYLDLRRDVESSIWRVCRSLGLPWEQGITEVSFRANTSFKGGVRTVLSIREALLAFAVHGVTQVLPLRLLLFLQRANRGGSPLHRGMYGDLARQYGIELENEELTARSTV